MATCHSASGVSDMLEAGTTSMRSAGDRLRRAGHTAQQLGDAVRDEAAQAGAVIEDGAVAAAATAAIQAVAAQLAVCAAGLEHAAGGVCGAADSFEGLDASVASGLSAAASAMGASSAG